jgi:outer membrane protein
MFSGKIGVVDMNRVFREYHKTRQMEQKLNSDRDRAKKDMDARASQYRSLSGRLAEIDKTLKDRLVSEQIKQQKYREGQTLIEEANRMGQEIQEFAGRRERQLQDTADRLKRELVKEIVAQAGETSKRNNFDFVFDRSGLSISGTPLMPVSRDAADLSAEIIADLNRNAPAPDTAKVTPSPPPDGNSPKAAAATASASTETAPSGR